MRVVVGVHVVSLAATNNTFLPLVKDRRSGVVDTVGIGVGEFIATPLVDTLLRHCCGDLVAGDG